MKSLSVKIRVVLFLIGLAIFGNIEVWGADWKLVEDSKTSSSDSDYYIDTTSIKEFLEGKFRFWILTVFLPPGTTKPTIDEAIKQGRTDYIELDCSKKRYRSVKTEKEQREGFNPIHPIHWYNIEPDSVYEKMSKVVCERK
jgi:hypothetical protein